MCPVICLTKRPEARRWGWRRRKRMWNVRIIQNQDWQNRLQVMSSYQVMEKLNRFCPIKTTKIFFVSEVTNQRDPNRTTHNSMADSDEIYEPREEYNEWSIGSERYRRGGWMKDECGKVRIIYREDTAGSGLSGRTRVKVSFRHSLQDLNCVMQCSAFICPKFIQYNKLLIWYKAQILSYRIMIESRS